MRLATTTSPWKWVLYALVAIVVLLVLRWIDQEDKPVEPKQMHGHTADGYHLVFPTYIVKLRPGFAEAATVGRYQLTA